MFSGVRKARSSISAAAALTKTPPPKPMLGQQLLEFRILVEKGARDLAAQGPDKRLEIDALHHRFRVAARGGRRKLRRAGERPTPIGRDKDDERDRAADKGSHEALYQTTPGGQPLRGLSQDTRRRRRRIGPEIASAPRPAPPPADIH